MSIKVTFYQRKPQGSNFSIERLFDSIRGTLPSEIEYKVVISRFESRGIFRRIYNIIEAAFHQQDVNHITGDVHFLTYLLKKKKTILTIHDLVTVRRLTGLRKRLFVLLWYKIPVYKSAVVTVISEATKKELLEYVNCEKKVVVVHDCVSDDFQSYYKDFDASMPVILQIGTGENKNLLRVIQALKNVPCHFRIIGKLNKEQMLMLEKCCVNYSSASNLTDEEIVEEYKKCDLVVFVSTYEGFGLPVLEAQATGRPVVTSNIMPLSEVAGGGACLVDPYDVAAIREGIWRVITDKDYREGLIQKGFENVSRFRCKAIAAQYAELYKQIVAR